MHVGVFLLEDVCNQSPIICADILWEKTTPPLTIGDLTNCLPQLYCQKGDVKAARQEILHLFVTVLDTALPGPDIFQCIPHQACVYTYFPEV